MAMTENASTRRAAQRFSMEAPVVLWPDPANPTRSMRSRTKDVSRIGFWVHGELDRKVGTPIRFEVRLPSPIGGETGCLLRGHGTVVRHVVSGDQRVGFAAKIDQYTMYPLPKTAVATEPSIERSA